MAEYIEREALLKEVADLKKSPWYNDDYGFGTRQARHEGVDCVVDLCIKQAPTVDVVEVVRCKDCKHYKFGKHFTDIKFCQRVPYYAEKGGLNTSDDDFCSYGERKCNDG